MSNDKGKHIVDTDELVKDSEEIGETSRAAIERVAEV